MRPAIARYSSVVVMALGAALAAPSAEADPALDCVAITRVTGGSKSSVQFQGLQQQIAALDQPEGAPREQVVAASKKQIGLLRQERSLLLRGAEAIGDQELADALRDNAEAIGAYADAFEKVLPYSQENPPPEDVKDAFGQARERSRETGEAMGRKVVEFCDFGASAN
ncbi:hypothetical protein [Segniliparus rugosus]|uniref:Uncharacterized protein n=1 Tax=Segniliparus rugosus (strain ATCC BAA-974 / DSM 45345 / CCUG 50838 / CIP 108380 / JCM 13579 / CDC 945) TaxID=679197 RepID=E5XUW9_SEGRC|nr:hypothetical protein [Segniliparus rugosus]EFV11805.2 hypothetical protein HMPREF9336_03291 [Segniliparus rugosus ATCC BAA-974]